MDLMLRSSLEYLATLGKTPNARIWGCVVEHQPASHACARFPVALPAVGHAVGGCQVRVGLPATQHQLEQHAGGAQVRENAQP
jgi:hypothetical protein